MSNSNLRKSSVNNILVNLRDFAQQDYAAATVLAIVYAGVVLAIGLLIWPSQELEIRGVEPAIAWHVREFLTGKSMYPALDKPPFSVNQYTPVYYWILSFILKVADANPTDPLHILRAGRLLSLFLSVVTSGVVFHIARSIFSTSRVTAVGGAIMAMAWPLPENIVARSDSLYLLCCTVTIWLFLKYAKEAPRLRFALYALGILIATFFVRQTVVVFMGAFALTVLALRPRQEVLKLIAIVVTAIAAVGLVFSLFETGNFLRHITAGVSNGIDIRQAMASPWLDLVRGFQVPLIVIVAALLTLRTARPDIKTLTLLASACLGLDFLLSFKYGSDLNYFDEFFLVSAILYAVLVEELRDWFGSGRVRFNAFVLMASLILLFGALAQNFHQFHKLRFADIGQVKQLSAAVARFAGEGDNALPVITDDDELALYVKGPVWLPQFKTWTTSVMTGAINPAVATQSARKAIAIVSDDDCPDSKAEARANVGAKIIFFTRRFFKDFVIVDRVSGYCILRYPAPAPAPPLPG